MASTASSTACSKDIDERLKGKASIMPVGLDKQLTLQQLADVVAFLKEGK